MLSMLSRQTCALHLLERDLLVSVTGQSAPAPPSVVCVHSSVNTEPSYNLYVLGLSPLAVEGLDGISYKGRSVKILPIVLNLQDRMGHKQN